MSMISEWMDYGDLKSYVEGHPGVNRIGLCIDVCAGLCHIHEKGMVHGDLKAANVMVSPGGLAMLADFGNSRLKDLMIKFTNTAHRGRSVRWTAPELLQEESGSDVTREADVYAFGMETLTGKKPYEGTSEQRLTVMIASKYKHPALPTAIAGDGLWNLLTRCWSEEPSKRPIIKDVKRQLQTLPTSAGGINAGGNPMPRRARRQQSHPLSVSTPEQKVYDDRVDQVVKGKESSAAEASGSNSGERATGREQGGAKTDSRKETLINDTVLVRERARPTVSRRSTLPNESRAAVYQETFGSCPRPQPDFRVWEDNAYYSPDAHFSQYRPHPDVFGRLYSHPPPPMQYGDGKSIPPPPPSMDESQSPQTASQKPGSKADGGRPPWVILARPLPREPPDPATERLTRQGLAPAQASQVHHQRTPMPAENVHAARVGVEGNASPLGRRDRAYTCSAEDAPSRPQMHSRSVSAGIVRPTIPTNEVTLSPAASLSGTAITGEGIALSRKLKGSLSKESLIDYGLRISSVPQVVMDSVSDQEKKRQEAVNEVIYTERDFVRDLEYIQDRWMEPLRTEDIIPPERRIDYVQQVFRNIEDILDVNGRLRDLLTKRQNAHPIVETISDIFSELVPQLQPFVQYGKHQLYGEYEFKKEKSINPAFASFVEMVERLQKSRKLELNGCLTKPMARLAWYPQLLEAVLEHRPEDNPDRVEIPRVVKMVREFLSQANGESGKTENRFNLLQLDKGLVYRPGEEVDLKLKDEQRQLVYKGSLERRGGPANENGDLKIFLFDHALLMAKSKTINKQERLKVFRRPIPLELLVVSTPEEYSTRPDSQKPGYQFTVSHLGKKGYSLTLWAPTVVARRKWVEHITAQQEALRERSMVFDTFMLSEDVFVGPAKVNCSVPYDYGRRIAYGTDVGVYFQSLYEGQNRTAIRGIEIPDVQQIDVLEEYQLLVVLSERSVLTFPLDALDFADPLKRMKRISSHTSFFKAGYCLGRTLVCVVKASSLSSTIKVLEPIDQSVRGKSKPTFKQLLQGGNDTLKVLKGFEIVDLETLDTQVLLDPADAPLDFVRKHEDVCPVSIYGIGGEFLLCYTEFAFHVDKSGWRSKQSFTIYWEGSPTAFALYCLYVMAFDPTFIEIRPVDDGSLVQVIHGNNLRLLFFDTPPWVVNSSSIGSGPTTPPSHRSPNMDREYNQYKGVLLRPGQKRVRVRDEIVVASGDKVMAVQLTAHPRHLSRALE